MKHRGYYCSRISQSETKNCHKCPIKLSTILVSLKGKEALQTDFKDREERHKEEKQFAKARGLVRAGLG